MGTKVTPPEQLALPATRSPCNSLSPGNALCLQIFNSSRPSSSRPSPSRAPTYKSDSTRTTRSPCNSLSLQRALPADHLPAELQLAEVTPPEQLALPATRSPCNSLSRRRALPAGLQLQQTIFQQT